jgi:hypothetical protein
MPLRSDFSAIAHIHVHKCQSGRRDIEFAFGRLAAILNLANLAFSNSKDESVAILTESV